MIYLQGLFSLLKERCVFWSMVGCQLLLFSKSEAFYNQACAVYFENQQRQTFQNRYQNRLHETYKLLTFDSTLTYRQGECSCMVSLSHYI